MGYDVRFPVLLTFTVNVQVVVLIKYYVYFILQNCVRIFYYTKYTYVFYA